ncbi:MAG: FecR domain-containing protein, partial [Flavobacteriaceae bacterium]|nr:FecR domain-containing protein [Flavobacteriaceae bacterium]
MKTKYGFLLVSLLITFQLYAAPIASILKVKNDVSIKKEADFEFQTNITAGTAIDIFDKLNTGAESYAAVIFLDDKSMVKIRENAEIEISESGNIREITVDKGQVLFDVNPQKIKDFVVKTPVSVASVKGTSFWVITDGESEQFITKEGIVNVFNPETMESMDVPAGQMCMVSADGLMSMQPFTAADLPDESIFEDETVAPEPEEAEEEEEAVEEEVIEEEIIEESASIPEEDNTDTETVSSDPITVPATEEMPAEDPEEEEPAEEESGDEKFGMGMGVGAVTLDGVLYNQIAARPTFKIGKIGVGLDIVLYIDNEGNIRKDDWDNFASYVDKIFFLSWGNKGDPIYAKVGGLDNITIGN